MEIGTRYEASVCVKKHACVCVCACVRTYKHAPEVQSWPFLQPIHVHTTSFIILSSRHAIVYTVLLLYFVCCVCCSMQCLKGVGKNHRAGHNQIPME